MISVPPAGGPRFRPWGENRDPPSGSASETNNDRQIKFELIHLMDRWLRIGLSALVTGTAASVVSTAALALLAQGGGQKRVPANERHQPLAAWRSCSFARRTGRRLHAHRLCHPARLGTVLGRAV